jgi:hypothetical protein
LSDILLSGVDWQPPTIVAPITAANKENTLTQFVFMGRLDITTL